MKPIDYLKEKGIDYGYNYPPNRQEEVEKWMSEYAELYHKAMSDKKPFVFDKSKQIHQRISDLAEHYNMSIELKYDITEISKQSYKEGFDACFNAMNI